MNSALPNAVADAIESQQALDTPAAAMGAKVRAAIPEGPVKDVLAGKPIGHPAHPLLTDLPIGFFTSAVLLDLIGGRGGRPAADKLIALGLLSTLPTVATGWSDWADVERANPEVRRVGIVHASANASAAALMGASLVARLRGSRGRGKLLGLAGMGLLGAGGWLGGHLSYAQGANVARATPKAGPADPPRPADPAHPAGPTHPAGSTG